MQIKRKIKEILKNYVAKKGLKTNRQIIVFESDDWGADRNSTKVGLENFKKEYPSFVLDNYQKFDTLESNEDVSKLQDVLMSVKDSKGNPANFTLNFATANIDFEKTKENGKVELVAIDEYYKKFKDKKDVLSLIKSGEQKGVFTTALHAREHINSKQLMSDVSKDEFVKTAFENGVVGVKNSYYHGMDALNTDAENLKETIESAGGEFERIFGRKSESFIAPCYVWSFETEKLLENAGVKFMQGNLFHNIPLSEDSYKKKIHYFGSLSKHSSLRYFYRNCAFEPSAEKEKGKTDEQILSGVLAEIENAFKMKKPAIICSHRVNFVGGMSEENRENNLQLLKKLLEAIVSKYSNVEFMDSASMCKEMLIENV